MLEEVRQHLVRLRDLTAQLNAYSDDVSRVAQSVEDFLNDSHVGVESRVEIESDQRDGMWWKSELVYGRYEGGQFRLFVAFTNSEEFDDKGYAERQTLWANCARDERLRAYEKLPQLLAQLVGKVEERVEKLRISRETVNTILELAPARTKKGGKR